MRCAARSACRSTRRSGKTSPASPRPPGRPPAVALVLERVAGDYHTTLDGNEQYGDVEGVIELLRRVASLKKLARFAAGIAFLEQPGRRSATMGQHHARLAEGKPV